MLARLQRPNIRECLLTLTLLLSVWGLSAGDRRETHNLDIGPAKPKPSFRLTAEQKERVLAVHNTLRRIPDHASDMLAMVWDDDLETAAVQWVENCNHGREFPKIGKYTNISHRVFTSSNWQDSQQDAFQEWYDGTIYFNRRIEPTCENTLPCLTLKKMIWSKTKAVGCAIKHCRHRLYGNSFVEGYFIPCIYGPGIPSNPGLPYTEGEKPCSECPAGYDHCVDKLCSTTPVTERLQVESTSDQIHESALVVLLTSLCGAAIIHARHI